MTRRLVVEADGGSRGNPGPAAYGAVVKDADTGEVLAERAEAIGRATNNVAEYRGLIAGLHAARQVDPDATVEARLDSKLVVEQMSGRWKIKHADLRPLALAARDVLPPGRVRYQWVPRAQNAHADALLNATLDAAARGGAGAAPEPGQPLPGLEPPVRPRPGARPLPRPDLGPPTTLVLLRHGETEHTAARRFSGRGGDDPGLSDLGRQQAARVAARLTTRTDLAAVISSPLRRCRETAEVVADRLDLPVRVVDAWAEASFGSWDGLTWAEVNERWPEELAGWLASTAAVPPGGESLDAVASRVAAARDEVLAAHPRRAVLVATHLAPLTLLALDVLGAPASSFFHCHVDPASMTELAYWPDGGAVVRALGERA